MKKLASACASLLLVLSTSVFAEASSTEQALKHASEAVTHGKAGHTPLLLEHAKAALEDALVAAIVAKGVSKNHLEAGAKELQESIDHGTMGHVGVATTHAEAAVEHIKASKK
ncbi:MAG: small metal-binding protein SmbP [Methylobacter sp.]